MSGKRESFILYGQEVKPGTSASIDIPLADAVTQHDVVMNVYVVHGKKPGPVVFISAAIHGDEINGVEIIRRTIRLKSMKTLKGTLIAIPIVNVFGFVSHSRYVPDGRDLNRCFPGSDSGSLAGRMAHTFFTEIVKKCNFGIDLHTGARHRENLPQIRADLTLQSTKDLAHAFGVPMVIDSKIRDGSLRQAAGDVDVPVLLYEAGEALRFDEVCIRAGVRGIRNVLRFLGMLAEVKKKTEIPANSIICNRSSWVRAPQSGILRTRVPMGGQVKKDQVLANIGSASGNKECTVVAPKDGIVIGRTNMPLVYEGDALFHLAYYSDATDEVFQKVEQLQAELEPESGERAGINSPPII